MAQYVLGSLTARTVPPTSLPPCISLSLAGFQILVPGGGLKALPYFQVDMSYGPWFTAPGGATCLALLSLPAGAASGNCFGACCAHTCGTATPSAAHVNDILIRFHMLCLPYADCEQ